MPTKLVMLGTGTPNACINASGPSLAIVTNNKAYLVDFGPGVVRQAHKAYHKKVDALRPDLLSIAFCTHLHSDHTAGLSDLILTPWVLERNKPLQLFGPKGLKDMADHITKAYKKDIDFRINGPEHANTIGYKTDVHEIEEGIIYRDENVSVEAFRVDHGMNDCFGYKFITDDKTIVVSGDTKALDIISEKAKDVDILVHEVEYTNGLKDRDPKWYHYHQSVHTLSVDLADIAKKCNPKLIVTTHRIYHMNILDNSKDIQKEIDRRDELILKEIKDADYNGLVVNGKDLDIY